MSERNIEIYISFGNEVHEMELASFTSSVDRVLRGPGSSDGDDEVKQEIDEQQDECC